MRALSTTPSPPLAGPPVGLLGGSFDPVHVGHLALAHAALAHLPVERVVMLPAGRPWQRAPLAASDEDRLQMLQLACAGHPQLLVDPQELARHGPTYTIDTLDALGTRPDDIWLMGADQLANFCSWHRWQDIASRVRLCVAQRPGSPATVPDALQQWLAAQRRPVISLPMPPYTVSATEIRQRLAQGASTDGLLHPDVARYIVRHHLYRTPPDRYTPS